MRLRLIFFLLCMSILAWGGRPTELSKISVMSYNIRQADANDGTNSWQFRYPATVFMIEDRLPDVMGVQEADFQQLYFIQDNVRGYGYVGVGQKDGKKKGEFTAVVYRKKTMSVLKWGTFWLSENPDKPGSGWDGTVSRTATWALMRDKATGKKFYFVNTQLDETGAEARREGLALIMARMADINKDDLPLVLVGDFGMESVSALGSKMKDARKIAAKTDSRPSFHGWGKTGRTVDHIFYSGFLSCTEFQTVTQPYDGRKFISDHYPVSAVLVF